MGGGERRPYQHYHHNHSFDSARSSLDRSRDSWVALAPRVNVKVEFLQKLDDYDFMKNPYAKKVHPGMPLRDVFLVNEHLAVTMSFVANVLVLLVFIRVLGTARLPSRIIVSIACANLLSSIAVAVHALSLSSLSLTNSDHKCRFISFLTTQCVVLWYFTVGAALVERTAAICIPGFYSRGQHILGPALLVSPWAYWTLNMVLLHVDLFKFNELEAGYECNNHMNYVFIHPSMRVPILCVTLLAVFLLCGLGISLLLQNQNSGDIWEINRMKFERRTTALMIKVFLVSAAFIIPVFVFADIAVADGRVTYPDLQVIHGAAQIAIHKGLALPLVLLTRPELRRQLVMVLESSETIRRARTTNLLIAQGAARNFASRQLRFSGGNVLEPASVVSVSTVRRQTTTGSTQTSTQVSSGHGVQGMVGRDKIAQVRTPEWLEKKTDPTQQQQQQQQQGHLARLLNRTIAMPTFSQRESDV